MVREEFAKETAARGIVRGGETAASRGRSWDMERGRCCGRRWVVEAKVWMLRLVVNLIKLMTDRTARSLEFSGGLQSTSYHVMVIAGPTDWRSTIRQG
jgi:hypothetical protein